MYWLYIKQMEGWVCLFAFFSVFLMVCTLMCWSLYPSSQLHQIFSCMTARSFLRFLPIKRVLLSLVLRLFCCCCLVNTFLSAWMGMPRPSPSTTIVTPSCIALFLILRQVEEMPFALLSFRGVCASSCSLSPLVKGARDDTWVWKRETWMEGRLFSDSHAP